MENSIDLQIQSTASDGKHTPRDILEMAKELHLQVIALTDHDTVAGVPEILAAASHSGVRVIPGIELSVEERGTHILGYGIDYNNPALLASLEESRKGREAGARQMVENLKGAGFVVEWDDVVREATGAVVARPHLARGVLHRPENKEKLGGIATVYDFIQKYLTDESPLYVKRTHISAKDAIALIHGAGGVAVWSHPAIHFKDNYEGLEEFLKELIGWGLDGMEVCNPSHDEDDVEFVQALTVKYNLLRTAGSDFHEKATSPRSGEGKHSAAHLGDFETYGFSTEDSISRLDAAIAARRVATTK